MVMYESTLALKIVQNCDVLFDLHDDVWIDSYGNTFNDPHAEAGDVWIN